jgi:dTDP-4-dehydrorhamnose reductase
MKPLVAVSGKNGQLGWELQRLAVNYPGFEFIFCDKSELDITNEQQLKELFQTQKPVFFINCAAYTAVDKAETDQEKAFKANAEAVGSLAIQCQQYNTTLITFSTDYVFNGSSTGPYKEDETTDPINYYGHTKWMGEKLALANCDKAIVIRTSWVYSSHGHNFVKTMLRLMKERTDINVVNDQLGSPTYAKDLAEVTLQIIQQLSAKAQQSTSNIYNYANDGIISWFDFASEIKRLAGLNCNVHPIPTSSFPTPAKRPAFSGLDKKKIVSAFGIKLKPWQESLEECLKELR